MVIYLWQVTRSRSARSFFESSTPSGKRLRPRRRRFVGLLLQIMKKCRVYKGTFLDFYTILN